MDWRSRRISILETINKLKRCTKIQKYSALVPKSLTDVDILNQQVCWVCSLLMFCRENLWSATQLWKENMNRNVDLMCHPLLKSSSILRRSGFIFSIFHGAVSVDHFQWPLGFMQQCMPLLCIAAQESGWMQANGSAIVAVYSSKGKCSSLLA